MPDFNPILDHLDHWPDVLYKYRTFDDCGFGVSMAAHGVAYFASAPELNDPFDTRFRPTSVFLELEGEALRDFLVQKSRQHEPGATEERIQQLVEMGILNHERTLAGDTSSFEHVLDLQAKRRGILSLTATPKHVAMWAYYSNNHQGLCVGLSTRAIGEHQQAALQNRQLMMLNEVNYEREMPSVSVDVGEDGMSDEELEELDKTFYTKSRQWSHEEEYRLLFDEYTAKPYVFGTSAVQEIIVGLRASDENIESLLKSLEKSGSRATVKKAKQSLSSFELDFELISSG